MMVAFHEAEERYLVLVLGFLTGKSASMHDFGSVS